MHYLSCVTPVVDRDSLIRANATVTGEGGRVIVWADQNTGYFGRITGRGATGQGGFVEVSGKENLAFDGTVELQGFNGLGGSLLLDPANIVIQAAAGNGDGLLPTVLASDVPDPMTISAGALAGIAAGTAINITASNNIDFQSSVTLITPGTALITFTAPTITASAGAVALNSNGRNIVLNGTNNINAANLSINTDSGVAGVSAGSFQATASTGDLTLGTLGTGASFANGGAITLNASTGNITSGNILSPAFGGNAGAINITAQGNITSGRISSYIDNGSGSAGAVSLTAQGNIITSGDISSYVNFGSGGNAGAVSVTAQGNIITSGNISSYVNNTNSGNSGAVGVTSQGNITSGEINSYVNNSIGNSGAVNITAQGNITSGRIGSYANTLGNGGTITLNATQGISTSGSIESFGTGTGNNSGAIDITAGNLIRVGLNSASCTASSICSSGFSGAGNGAITIRHGGSTTTPFIVGDSTTNGTTGRIDAGTGNIINTTFSVPVPPDTYTQGIVQIITTVPVVPPVVPAVVPAVVPTATSSTIPPELLTQLQNPPAPPTPAAVVVGTPPVEPVVESPIAVTPVVVPTPQPNPLVITNPIPTPISSPVVVTTPIPISTPSTSPTLSSELRTTLANVDPQDTVLEPEPPSGTLAFITNPSRAEIAARLSTLGNSQNDLSAIQNNLNQTATNSDTKPAQIYVFFTPQNLGSRNEDTLEIILITGRGEPRRVQLSGITRRQVLGVLANLRSSNGNEAINLNAARQFYQWLLAPLESELQQQGINNLVFVLDQELRGLPLESLYDGQRFIRERYTISRP